jgi:predicted negative regulator of RcsB-dependent stress response
MAIDDLLDEHEQGERVRGWLRENGGGLLTGVLLGLALILGWQWWQQQREHKRFQAGEDYQAAVEAIQAGKPDARKRIAALPEGAYRTLGALALAKAQVDAGKRDEAIATLQAESPDDPELAGVVRQRLARLLLDAGKPKDAIALLGDAQDDPLAAVIRGDAHVALGEQEQARAAYDMALAGLAVGSPLRNLVAMKLVDAGGAPPDSGARTGAPTGARS